MSVSQSHNTPKPHLAGQLNGDGNGHGANVVGKTPGPLSQRVLSLRLPESPAQEGSAGRLLPWGICLLLAAGLAVASYFAIARPRIKTPTRPTGRQPRRPSSPASPSAAQAPAAETASSGAIVLEAKGYIVPVHQILVSPKVSGMIVRLPIQEGMRVKKGDVVAELEDTDYRADYEHGRGQLGSRQAALAGTGAGIPAGRDLRRPRPSWPSPRRNWSQLKAEWERTKRLLPQNGHLAAGLRGHGEQVLGHVPPRRAAANGLEADAGRPPHRAHRQRPGRGPADEGRRGQGASGGWTIARSAPRSPAPSSRRTPRRATSSIPSPSTAPSAFARWPTCPTWRSICPSRSATSPGSSRARSARSARRPIRDRTYEGYVSRLMPIADRAKGAVPVRVKVTVPADGGGRVFEAGDGRERVVPRRDAAGECRPRKHKSRWSSQRAPPESDCRRVRCTRRILPLPAFHDPSSPQRHDRSHRGSPQVFPPRQRTARRAQRPDARSARGRVPRPDGPQRLRQDHAAEPHRRAGSAQRGRGVGRRPADLGHVGIAVGPLAHPAPRLRLPVLSPAAGADGL